MEGSGFRLVVWNCGGGFRRKRLVLQRLLPDIAIIPEASEDFAQGLPRSSSLWIGAMLRPGLGIVAFNGWTLERADVDVTTRLFLPCVATRGTKRVQIVGVCAKKTTDYVSPTLDALQSLAHFIGAGPTVLAGDFNGSISFNRPIPFQFVLDRLDGLDMRSAWHQLRGENFGEETVPTYFMHWSDDPKRGHTSTMRSSQRTLAWKT